MFIKGNHYKRYISAGLLILLLSIHCIKFFHSHANSDLGFLEKNIHNGQLRKFCFESNSVNDCSVCTYQLAKDSDDLIFATDVYIPFINFTQASFNTIFKSSESHSTFGNKGPPVLI